MFTTHALSYPDHIDNFFIPLLFAGSQPYDAIVCTSRAARGAFENLLAICAEGIAQSGYKEPSRFNGQFHVLPLGVDVDLHRPRDRTDVRHQLGLPQDACVLLWLGRLSPTTKADLLPLILAYRAVRDRTPDSRTVLVLVGSDPEGYGRTVEAHAAAHGIGDAIRVERTTPQTPVHLWYSAADVFVSPIDNFQESFGLATVEAMASGVPQVVTDWDGHRDTVVHGQTGFMARTFWAKCDDAVIERWASDGDSSVAAALLSQTVACDVGQVATYLEYLIRSPDLRRQMGAASRARALTEFAWPVVVRRYVECWNVLVEQSARGALPGPPARVLPNFFRAFAGYASDALTGNTRVRITPAAAGGTEDHQPVTGPPAVAGAASVAPEIDALEQVLATIEEAGGESTVDALTRRLARVGHGHAEVIRHVLWCVKYGLLEVVG